MGRLNDKNIIITGATGGIGKATLELFVREGAQVFAIGRNEERLRELVASHGDRVAYAVADMASDEALASAFTRCRERFGRIDALIANAAMEGPMKPLIELSVDEYDQVYRVNTRSVFLAIKHCAPAMVEQGKGSIVITSSALGLVAMAGMGAYVTSKHALTGLMRTAALELAPHGVRVNTVHPGAVDNRMMRSIEHMAMPEAPNDLKATLTKQIPLGRYATDEDVAKMFLYLAGDDSTYVTGATLVIDGGYTAA